MLYDALCFMMLYAGRQSFDGCSNLRVVENKQKVLYSTVTKKYTTVKKDEKGRIMNRCIDLVHTATTKVTASESTVVYKNLRADSWEYADP